MWASLRASRKKTELFSAMVGIIQEINRRMGTYAQNCYLGTRRCGAGRPERDRTVELNAQSTPDFSGVYYPVQQGRGGAGGAAAAAPPAGQRGTPPPPPTRSAPTGDLSNGRAPNAPSLTPEYMAKWEIIRKSRMSGSYEYDPIANCLPPGMPQMMSM